jgi:hypothetical protein
VSFSGHGFGVCVTRRDKAPGGGPMDANYFLLNEHHYVGSETPNKNKVGKPTR